MGLPFSDDLFELTDVLDENMREKLGGNINDFGRQFADETKNPLLRNGTIKKIKKDDNNHWLYKKVKKSGYGM